MKEFWFWVAIVTLIIFCLMGMSVAIIHMNKQIKEMDAMIARLEEKHRRLKMFERKDDE
jgi:sensor domain CHASE-containing protein